MGTVHNFFKKILPYFLLAQGVYLLYLIVKYILVYFSPSYVPSYHLLSLCLIAAALLVIAGIGLLRTVKTWPLVVYCFFSIIPHVLYLAAPLWNMFFLSEPTMIVLNLILALYLSASGRNSI
jgi:hypothetical protein